METVRKRLLGTSSTIRLTKHHLSSMRNHHHNHHAEGNGHISSIGSPSPSQPKSPIHTMNNKQQQPKSPFVVSSPSNTTTPTRGQRIKSLRSNLRGVRKWKLGAILSCLGCCISTVRYMTTLSYTFVPPTPTSSSKYTTSRFLELSKQPISPIYLPQRPRIIGTYYTSASSETYLGTEYIDPNTFRLHRTFTIIDMDVESIKIQRDIKSNSNRYHNSMADLFEDTDTNCYAQYEWQLHHHPNCNHLMEYDLTHLEVDPQGNTFVQILAHGYWRDVWRLQNHIGVGSDSKTNTKISLEKTVLKTMRYEHKYTARNYDRHRRDAVAMEQLSSSPWVVEIYGFCGNAGIFEFADGGSLQDSIFQEDNNVNDKDGEFHSRKWSSSERVIVAYQVASGLAAVHNHPSQGGHGLPAIAHTDIGPGQYVYMTSSGSYKLNDFNRCRFMAWNNVTNDTCPFFVGNNPGIYRSPEEYAYKGETEKVDVYSMKNIFFEIMHSKSPFQGVQEDEETVQSMIKGGTRATINATILNSTDPFDQALVHAIYRCWEQDPKVRATASEIQHYLEDTLVKLGVEKT